MSIAQRLVDHGRWGLWALLAAGVAGGCASPHPGDAGADAAVATAAGLSSSIVFRTEGAPLDEPHAGASLPLAEAVRLAVTTDPTIQAALARVRVAMAEADQARLLPNPVLNIVVRWGPGKPQIEASLAQDLVQALQIPRRAGAADNRLRQAAAESVTVAIDVIAQVQEQYAAVQAGAALEPILREQSALVDRLVAVARQRVDAGEGTRAELSTLEAQRVELLVELDRVTVAQRESRLRLARMVGEPSSGATWTLDAWPDPGPSADLPAESEWVRAALLQRPEILSVAWRLRALGDDEALARLLPWEGGGAGIDAQRDADWSLGPSISTPVPVFDMGQAARARVAAQQAEARHDLTQARRKVVEEVRVAYQVLAASNANLARMRGQLIPLQRQRGALAEDAYRAGQTDVTPVYLAEQDLRKAEAQAVEIERQAATARIRLERAVGGPGVAAIVRRPVEHAAQEHASPSAGAVTSTTSMELLER